MRELAQRNNGLKLIVEFNAGVQMKAYGNYTRFFETLVDLGFKRFHAIRHGLKAVRIPDDIEKIVRMTETTRYRYINLLCEI